MRRPVSGSTWPPVTYVRTYVLTWYQLPYLLIGTVQYLVGRSTKLGGELGGIIVPSSYHECGRSGIGGRVDALGAIPSCRPLSPCPRVLGACQSHAHVRVPRAYWQTITGGQVTRRHERDDLSLVVWLSCACTPYYVRYSLRLCVWQVSRDMTHDTGGSSSLTSQNKGWTRQCYGGD